MQEDMLPFEEQLLLMQQHEVTLDQLLVAVLRCR